MDFQGGISETAVEKMDGVNAFVIGLAVLLVAWIFFKSRHGSSDQTLKLPPGPPPLPIIGNLHMLGKLPDRKLQELSKKYRPIMFLRLGSVPTDMLTIGTDTSSATLEWALSEMLLNPSIMKKVQEELESVVGLKRMVESDMPQLDYLKVVVKETLRLYPPGPLLIPHEAREDCIVGGYNIPRKARIIVNVFALGTDPNSWKDAEKFKPERFIGSPIDVKGQNFEVIPFGSGRRGCPGQPLATTVVEYALANLLHCFDWRLPDGMKAEDLSMTEKFGLSTPRAIHLVAVPTPRLPQP
eukprot:Gb_08444 [translate_table: standard]